MHFLLSPGHDRKGVDSGAAEEGTRRMRGEEKRNWMGAGGVEAEVAK
jgi:hypothetical protein